MSSSITIPRLNDMHCHFRLDDLLAEVLPQTARYAQYGLAMPNTKPRAILEAKDVIWYRDEQIMRVLDRMNPRPAFTPLMTIEIRDSTTPQIVRKASIAGAIAGKVYSKDVTTNSESGLTEFFCPRMTKTFSTMQDIGMMLLLHGEVNRPRLLVTRREHAFLPILRRLASEFPRLKIVLEHVSTAEGLEAIRQLDANVTGTITAHHLCLTLNDVIGDGIQPHNGCMPMPKDFSDRDALVAAATGQIKHLRGRVAFGGDSAAHKRNNKECSKGACGVYTAPVAPGLLAKIFEEEGQLAYLRNFTSDDARKIYGLSSRSETITLVREPWLVPEQYGSVVPFLAGTTMDWRLQ